MPARQLRRHELPLGAGQPQRHAVGVQAGVGGQADHDRGPAAVDTVADRRPEPAGRPQPERSGTTDGGATVRVGVGDGRRRGGYGWPGTAGHGPNTGGGADGTGPP